MSAGLGLGVTVMLIPIALGLFQHERACRRATDWHHGCNNAVPRLGGAVLVLAFLAVECGIAFLQPQLRSNTPGRNVVVLSSIGMFLLGFWDDLRPLGAIKKLTLQTMLAAMVWFAGIGIEVWQPPFSPVMVQLGVWSSIPTVVWLVSVTNLINLVDGVDGLAGGLCLFLMILVIIIAHQHGNFELLAAGMAGALIGFLWFNLPPARIYLGDGGAYFLGFQVALYCLINSHQGMVPEALISPIFLLALPITDAVLTVVRRGLTGLPLFRPDRKHLHHRLLSEGCSRRKAVLCALATNFLFLSMAVVAFWSRGRWVPGLIIAAVLILFLCAATFRFSRRWFAVASVWRGCQVMRGQVRYARPLVDWLEVESQRCSSPDELWPSLVFVCNTLGFEEMKLTLQGGHRVWQRKGRGVAAIRRRYDCPNEHYGSLELSVPACRRGESQGVYPCDQDANCCNSRGGGCASHPKVFEVISDLLAETWNKAALHWHEHNLSLSFNTSPISPWAPAKSAPPALKDCLTVANLCGSGQRGDSLGWKAVSEKHILS